MPKAKRNPRKTAAMAKRQKTRLCIVFGGKSGEHEVSLTSAASVISALDPEEFEITVIGITKEGRLANPSELRGMLPPSQLSSFGRRSGAGPARGAGDIESCKGKH